MGTTLTPAFVDSAKFPRCCGTLTFNALLGWRIRRVPVRGGFLNAEGKDRLIMSLSRNTWAIVGIGIVGLSGAATLAIAQAPSQDVISKLDDNQGILVDKQTFDVIKGNAKSDNPLATLAKMGAREVSAGAIVFRHGDKLYIVDGTPPAHAAPQAVKAFRSDWNVHYMKDFQDNFATAFKCRNC
jgi:hypothetical protein